MAPCVCGHQAALHRDYETTCLHWHECHCHEFVADLEPHETVLKSPSPWSNHYEGIYQTPRGGFDVS
jgi:hypothetical protein